MWAGDSRSPLASLTARGVRRLEVVDSHTAGEPTRLVLGGAPDLGAGSLSERVRRLRERHDWVRTCLVTEPRGSEAMVGALLLPASSPGHRGALVFFNGRGYLGMCGHAAIGAAVTLGALGRLDPGRHRFETAVGEVAVTLHDERRASVENVVSYRLAAAVPVEVDGLGTVRGDVAWGGNWFFLVTDHGLDLIPERIDELTRAAKAIREALLARGVRAAGGEPIDHIELLGPSPRPGVDARGFVLCPGDAFDRSPCGTGTSAELAALAADGVLREGAVWRQESIVGTVFEARYRGATGGILPTITGEAFVTASSTILVDPRDPFRHGMIRPGVTATEPPAVLPAPTPSPAGSAPPPPEPQR